VRVAIIGAGIAGLAAAHRLMAIRPDVELVVFEKGGEIGGRAATRRLHGATFDHGAQYLKTPTPELRRFITTTLGHATLVDINRPVWIFDGAGRISPGDPRENAEPKWTYTDGLARLASELAAGLDVRREAHVERLAAGSSGDSILYSHAGAELGRADTVLLTPPAPQTMALLARSQLPLDRLDSLHAELGRVRYRRCLSVTLGYPQLPREQPFYALVNTDRQHPISWLAYEHLKPGRDMAGQGVLIAQMAPAWSSDHWEDDLPTLAAATAELVSTLLGEDLRQPAWCDRQGWRYALPDGGCDVDRLHADDGLFFAGDYVAGQGRVHLAIESGWKAAERMAAYATP